MKNHDWRSISLAAIAPLITGAVYLIANTAWPQIAASLSGKIQYWFLRGQPLAVLVIPSLLMLAIIALMKLHQRRIPALATLATFLFVIASYALREYLRLSPYLQQYNMTWAQLTPYVDAFVIAGGILGFAACAVAARLSLGKSPTVKRARKAFFGDADWMSMKQAATLLPSDGEVVIGERYRVVEDTVQDIQFEPGNRMTWGQGGKSPLLTYKLDFDSTHMLFFAGSGGFKTTSNVVPTALRYSGPIVCLDPSTEVAPIVVKHRENELRRECFVLDPRSSSVGFNVLDWILTSPNKEEDIVAFAQLLLSESARVESSTGSYFQNQAHNLLTGLLAHVILSDEFADRRTLAALREIVSAPEPSVLEMLRNIQKNSTSSFIRQTLGVFTNMTEQTFSGVYSTASKDTQWLSLDAYAAMTCGNSFKSSDIARGNIDIFLNIPAAILRSYPGIARVIVGSLLNAMTQADGNYAKRTLFMLDEVDLLGYMRVLEEARDRGRKYGTTLMLMYQSVGQMEKHFGKDGAKSWLEGCAFTSYAAIKSIETAKELSASCGEMTIEVRGQSKSIGLSGSAGQGRATENVSYQRRPLIMPHEITQSMRKDEQIIVMQGQPPLRCGRAIYFRRKDMIEQTQQNRFAKT
ncbi:type IV secretion system protein VirD4 [Ochrobactrum anthropi]|uniref:Ti-type conjugative transfer system protein TraG n=1 Tax=Brucella anthropi TaxID=529 RepID=UPI0015F9FA39|nr:Ti-type conjugative transfer system protein TraG [Brucella anthropi]MBA8862764.1 type IV secretion system protein VirD4 [Brucella anthropi]